jgi:uncharacterized repeat protein (TIGR01451 family)
LKTQLKRPKILLGLLVTLALVISLSVMVTPVMASQISLAKNTDPLTPNKYYVGDTIHYIVLVGNPSGNNATNYVDKVEDTLPDGTKVILATNVTQAPGESNNYTLNYTVDVGDLKLVAGRWRVMNSLNVEGTDGLGDAINATTSANSIILRPAINISKTVDFDGDGVFTDLESNRAGQNATWNITVCNSGYDPVYNITVTDTNGHNFGVAFNLTVGECKTFTYDVAMNVTTTNNATAEGVDELGNPVGPVSDIAEVVVVDAKISTSPLTDTNAVGDDHPLTALVQADYGLGSGWEDYAGANVTFAVIDGVGSVSPDTDITDVNGEAHTTLTTTEAGNSTVQASTAITVTGVVFNLVTNGIAPNSDPAEKDWVEAKIEISPLEGTNKVGESHNLTACVYVDTGSGYGLYTEPITINFTKTAGVGSLSDTSVPTSTGCAQTTLTTTEAGNSTVTAQAVFNVDGVAFDISTDGTGDNSNPAEKDWVQVKAKIQISPLEGTNKVGESHNLTACVYVDTGSGYGLYTEPITINFTKTAGVGSLNATSVPTSTGCAQVTLATTEPGNSTVTAQAAFSVDGTAFDISTDDSGDNSGPAGKTWVDARISIEESGTNPVNTAHNFTVTVEMNDGDGWDPVVGINVTPWLDGSSTAGAIISAPPYTTDGLGQVIVTVNSATAGTATVHASATVNVGGIDIDVDTNGYGAYYVSNVKQWTSPGTCRITGGGTIGPGRKPRVTHGFELHCNVDQLPNNLEVNWGGDNFHLLELTFAECWDDPLIEPWPPRAGCDTYHGIGTGRYNGVEGYQAEWIFTDAGEPGKVDFAWIKITAPGGSIVLEVSGFLRNGNQQFHNLTGKDLRPLTNSFSRIRRRH